MMSGNQLTAEEQLHIQKYVLTLLGKVGAVVAAALTIIGFTFFDYAVSKAVDKAGEDNKKIVTDLTNKSVQAQVKVEKLLEDLNKKQKEIEAIRDKMLELQKGANDLANNESFASKVASYVRSEYTFRWEKIDLKERTHGFKSNCLYVLRTNDYRNSANLEGEVYGPEFRRVYMGISLAGAKSERGSDYLSDTLRYIDEEGKINTLSFMDLEVVEHGFGPTPSGITVPEFTAYEACFAPFDLVPPLPIAVKNKD